MFVLKNVCTLFVLMTVQSLDYNHSPAQVESQSHATNQIFYEENVMNGLCASMQDDVYNDWQSQVGISNVEKKLEDLHMPFLSHVNPVFDGKSRTRSSINSPKMVKFYNFRSDDLKMYWKNGSEEVFNGPIHAGDHSGTNSYIGHTFVFRKFDSGVYIMEHTVNPDQVEYVIPNEDGKITPLYQSFLDTKQPLIDYKLRTGTDWISHPDKKPPTKFTWATDYVGQTHTITTEHVYCKNIECKNVDEDDMIVFQLTVVDIKPRILIIEDVINEWERKYLIEKAKKTFGESWVGSGRRAFKIDSRRSKTAWINRGLGDVVVDTIFTRIADIMNLNISDGVLDMFENLQVLEYLPGQEYAPHHDMSGASPNSRWANFAMYLQPAEEGGCTSFPLAWGGKGLKICPPPGAAVLWYMILPDGNGDDLTLHAGTPVGKGVKYFANLWTWDPIYGHR